MKGKLQGAMLRYSTGVSVEFTQEEALRLEHVFARERSPYESQNSQQLPRSMKDFSVTQRALWADIMGDKEAKKIFGDGPWTQKFRKDRARERCREQRKRAKL